MRAASMRTWVASAITRAQAARTAAGRSSMANGTDIPRPLRRVVALRIAARLWASSGHGEVERVEVGSDVVEILVLGSLEEVDDQIGERRRQRLVADLEDEAEGEDVPH